MVSSGFTTDVAHEDLRDPAKLDGFLNHYLATTRELFVENGEVRPQAVVLTTQGPDGEEAAMIIDAAGEKRYVTTAYGEMRCIGKKGAPEVPVMPIGEPITAEVKRRYAFELKSTMAKMFAEGMGSAQYRNDSREA